MLQQQVPLDLLGRERAQLALLELGQELGAANVCLVAEPVLPWLDHVAPLLVLHVHARVVPDRDVAACVFEGEAAQHVDHLALDDKLGVPARAGEGSLVQPGTSLVQPGTAWHQPGKEVGTGPTVARPRARPMARSARPVSSTSAACTNMLPPRQGTSTPASRGAVRTSAMRMLRVDGGAAGLNQASGEAAEVRLLDVLRSDRPARDRSGRILGATRGRIFDQPGQLEPGLLRVQAKLRTSVLRSDFHSDSSVVVDDNVSDDEEGAGRGARVVREYMVTDDNLPDGDWQRLMPVEGKKLVGHLVCSLYHNQEGTPETRVVRRNGD